MKRRKGAMLLEVILALAITALVLAGGGTALRTIALLGKNVRRVETNEQQDRAHEALLRRIGRLANRDNATEFFLGSSTAVAFPSSCVTSRGWDEPCRVTIDAADKSNDSNTAAFRVTISDGNSFGFAKGAGSIRYLADARNGGIWLSAWPDSTTFPRAIELVAPRESLFIRFSGNTK